jgi:voltage-gated potassium channel
MRTHPGWNAVFRVFTRNVWQHVLIVRSVVGMLIILIVLHACAIAYFEHMKIHDSLYFAFVTAFTIGYGDIVPVTAGGRIVSLLVGVLGLIFTGLVVAIATRSLAETYRDVGNSEKE